LHDKLNDKKYRLINTYNIPLCELGSFHVCAANNNQPASHNFSFEFEKIQNVSSLFDLYSLDEESGAFVKMISDIKINENSKVNKLNLETFFKDTPLKELSSRVKNDNLIWTYRHNNLTIQALFKFVHTYPYRKFWQLSLRIVNQTGKDFLFSPSEIFAKRIVNDKIKDLVVLSADEYLSYIRSAQLGYAIGTAVGEYKAAASAGVSTSSSSTVSSGDLNTNSQVNFTDFYDPLTSVNGDINSRTTYNSRSTTYSTNYNGAAAYAARQNANMKIDNLILQQKKDINKINEGYLRANTISNNSEYIGYLNIDYKKLDNVTVGLNLNNSYYEFVW
jgi:hypothetical protein